MELVKEKTNKIAFGGGCHWCTEAVFQSLKGVVKVEQGFVASNNNDSSFSEAVIVHFKTEVIALITLIEVHLLTHKSTSNHSMRDKYRSAIYYFTQEQEQEATVLLNYFKNEFKKEIITKVIPFIEFKASSECFQNYYIKNPKKPFCEKYINPKLNLIKKEFADYT